MTYVIFCDFAGLENGLTKFHDFPWLWDTLIERRTSKHQLPDFMCGHLHRQPVHSDFFIEQEVQGLQELMVTTGKQVSYLNFLEYILNLHSKWTERPTAHSESMSDPSC